MGFPAQEPRSLLSRSQEQPEGSRAWTQEARGQRVGRMCVWGEMGDRNGPICIFSF